MNSKYKFIKKSSSRILLNMVGKYFQVYQGKRFINIYVSELMVGKFFGEFVRSRKRHIYNKKK
jgi:ribosomal protein S19